MLSEISAPDADFLKDFLQNPEERNSIPCPTPPARCARSQPKGIHPSSSHSEGVAGLHTHTVPLGLEPVAVIIREHGGEPLRT